MELRKNKKDLEFQTEYSLSLKPLQIDLVVIWKIRDHPIENEIGKLFRGYNLLEYKSPGDELGVDTYYKVLSYACLYKALGKNEDSIPAKELTITLVREGYPRKLFHFLTKEQGCSIIKKYPGVYYITGSTLFPVQVLVTGELDKKAHVWLTSLTRNLEQSSERWGQTPLLVQRIRDG